MRMPMRRRHLGLGLLLALVGAPSLLGGCAEPAGESDPDAAAPGPEVCDVRAPTECTEPSSSYADVEPIIQARCVGCHDGTSAEWPLTSYSHVADWAPDIRSMMLSCAMPPPESGLTMPTAEREALLRWIRCGFPP